MRPVLSLVLIAHDDPDEVVAVLETAMRRTGHRRIEWIVVDRGSAVTIREAVAARWPQVRVMPMADAARGFSAARGHRVLAVDLRSDLRRAAFERLVAAISHAGGPAGRPLARRRRLRACDAAPRRVVARRTTRRRRCLLLGAAER